MSRNFLSLYSRLLAAYGHQGWWPLPSKASAKGFDTRGYHRGSYDWPRSGRGRFEIILGSILTQNTAWTNAERALEGLRRTGITMPEQLLGCPPGRLSRLVRSSGYFNQKAKKLKAAAAVFSRPGALSPRSAPSREQLLALWGVGRETADSILLYAFAHPVFVVDAYTRRIFTRLGILAGNETYDAIQDIFHRNLPRRHELYNEMHALIVEHAKRHCRSRPLCPGCPIFRSCRFFRFAS
ncbi:MAG TPA: DNA repair protein [Spirochaetia bacterium]|nr:DNA repair protein [Spirochaetia bacterium]